MNATQNKNLIESLAQSDVFKEFERAFTEMTGMPVTLRPIDSWQLTHHGRKGENPFCAEMSQKSRSCAACLQTQQELSESVATEAATVTCPLGLCDSAVPIRAGENLIGLLQTGQIFRRKPAPGQFEKVAKQLAEWGYTGNLEPLRELYYQTPVLSTKHHDAVLQMLTLFAQHLSLISNQLVLRHENAEPAVIRRAKEYIRERHGEELSLGQVAKFVNTSSFYFCKLFKRVTGINFTDYVSRVRIEKAKNLLLNPNLRVSEIAFEVGFQSLTHFNRVFKRITGQSPTAYRGQLPSI